jgi:hypothetical protein
MQIDDGKKVVKLNSLGTGRLNYEVARREDGRLYLIYSKGTATNALVGFSFDHGDGVVCPPEEDQFTINTRFASTLKKYDSVSALLQSLEDFVSQCLDLSDSDRFLLACFALRSWVAESLPIAPYLALSGLPQSGKSTALKVLHCICYQALITSDITRNAFYEVYTALKPTILIDEVGGADGTRALFHLLRLGTNRGTVNFRGKAAYSTFGPKAFAWSLIPDDDALASRCVNITMVESPRTDLRRVTDPEIARNADELQCQLLAFRLDHRRKLQLPRLPAADTLCARDRDLYEALALAISADIAACQRLAEYFIKRQENLDRHPLPARETAIIDTLFEQIHTPRNNFYFTIRDLTTEANATLQKSGERLRLSCRAVGAGLTTLGFANRKRTQSGFVVEFDRNNRRRIHELMARYSLDGPAAHLPSGVTVPCEFCEQNNLPETTPVTTVHAKQENDPEPPDPQKAEHNERPELETETGMLGNAKKQRALLDAEPDTISG